MTQMVTTAAAARRTLRRHACTNGPGDFRYLFLIASSAQYVSAPIVTE
jgi:hypothetical protein